MSKSALITGSSKRIGKEIAIYLAEKKYNIAIHANTSIDEALSLSNHLQKKFSIHAKVFKADLSNETDLSDLVKRVHDSMGELELLINNASIFEPGSFRSGDNGLLERHLNINLKAPIILAMEFAKLVNKGSIINLLDSNITKDKSLESIYLLTKKSLAIFTNMAALEFAPAIRVNAISPGPILPPSGKDDRYLEELSKNIPLRSRGEPSQICNAINFLIENSYITGQNIFVDGGAHL